MFHSTNRFRGTLPSKLGSLSSLKYFLFYNNLFTGSIPATLCNLGNIKKLYPCDSTGTGCSPNSCIPSCISYLNTSADYGSMPYCTSAPTRVPTSIPTFNGSLPTSGPSTLYPPTAVPTRRPTASPYVDPFSNINQNYAMCALQGAFSWLTSTGTTPT